MAGISSVHAVYVIIIVRHCVRGEGSSRHSERREKGTLSPHPPNPMTRATPSTCKGVRGGRVEGRVVVPLHPSSLCSNALRNVDPSAVVCGLQPLRGTCRGTDHGAGVLHSRQDFPALVVAGPAIRPPHGCSFPVWATPLVGPSYNGVAGMTRRRPRRDMGCAQLAVMPTPSPTLGPSFPAPHSPLGGYLNQPGGLGREGGGLCPLPSGVPP